MQTRNIPFYPGLSSPDRIEIFVPEGILDADGAIDTWQAELYTTEQVLLIKTLAPQERFLATNINLRDEIMAGKKVLVSYLDQELRYIMPLHWLDFRLLS